MNYISVGGRQLLSKFPHLLANPSGSNGDDQPSAGAASPYAEHPAGAAPYPDSPDTGGACMGRGRGQNGGGASSSPLSAADDASVLLLHSFFDASQVAPWQASKYVMIRKLQDATRNRGVVHLMREIGADRLVAVKQMPNRWIQASHADFLAEHPTETELPWQDVGTINYLTKSNFHFGCQLLGVYRDDTSTYVVTSFCTEGDLFTWCEAGMAPGYEREALVLPLARQIMQGIRDLHELQVVHRDLSLENILLTKPDPESDTLQIRIIDFGMASACRTFRNSVRGKASYQAPELHSGGDYDAFLSDAFSLGVTLYALLLKDYPWLSTRPGGCKCFEYVRKHGFRSYLAKRKLRNSGSHVGDIMSEPLKALLEGLLALDPADRMTLGESAFDRPRRSIWDEPWMSTGPDPPKPSVEG